jgi:WD40 repeat protein
MIINKWVRFEKRATGSVFSVPPTITRNLTKRIVAGFGRFQVIAGRVIVSLTIFCIAYLGDNDACGQIRFWEKVVAEEDLAGIAARLQDPSSPAWPMIAPRYATAQGLESEKELSLARALYDKIYSFENAHAGANFLRDDRVITTYIALSRTLRKQAGSINYLLADGFTGLAVLHLGRRLLLDNASLDHVEALYRQLDLPMLSSKVLEKMLTETEGRSKQAKESGVCDSLVAAGKFQRFGPVYLRFFKIYCPPETYKRFFANPNSVKVQYQLENFDPAILYWRLMLTDQVAIGGLGQIINFFRRGGRLADINFADVRSFYDVVGREHEQLVINEFETGFGMSYLSDFLRQIRDPENSRLALWTLNAPLPSPAKKGSVSLVVREQSLVKFPRQSSLREMKISSDLRRVACVVQLEQGMAVLERGEFGKSYDAIEQLEFSPDGRSLIYRAKRDGKWLVIRDGVEGKAYDTIRAVKFSPDSRHLAYSARAGGKSFIFLDGIEGPEYSSISAPAFSPDGTLAYMARRQGRWIVIYKQSRSEEFNSIRGDVGIVFSPDGRRWAYSGQQGTHHLVVVDGASRAVYEAKLASGRLTPIFSADGSRLAYISEDQGTQSLEINGKSLARFDRVENLQLSPEGGQFVVVGKRDGAPVVWINGVERRYVFMPNSTVYFSADGKRVAYNGTDGGYFDGFVVLDGVQQPAVGHAGRKIVFSPDDKRVAWIVNQGGKTFVNVNGEPGPDYSQIWDDIAFSPNSRHFVYFANRGHYSKIVTNGVETKEFYDWPPFLKQQIVFENERTFRTLGVRNEELFQVEVEIVELSTK